MCGFDNIAGGCFEPVQIEGTTVSRASLCNLTEIERLGVGKECTLSVIKSQQDYSEMHSCKGCGWEQLRYRRNVRCAIIRHAYLSKKNSGVRTLHCTNPGLYSQECQKVSRFVSKSGMDIDGLSVQTMLKFINEGFIKTVPLTYTHLCLSILIR